MNDQLRQRFSSYREPQALKSQGVYPFFREIQTEQDTEVMVGGRKVLMFGSNSYLGLTTHPKVKEASEAAVKKYGTGSAGSRFLNGTLDIHVELENKLASFVKKEDAIVFSTGFQVNLGVIPAIAGKGDVILLDRLNHASIIEGARLSQAQTVMFRHNDMRSLEQKLKHCPPDGLKFIVVDGIFSMEGEIVDLPGVVALAEKYNAVVMTDCAHAIGVIGDHGSGTPSHFGLDDKVDLIGGTFSKSLASLGGFVAGDSDTINYLRHHARSLIFSASITPASAAAALESLNIIASDDSHRQRLWENTRYAQKCLVELGFDIGDSETPIIPIYIRDHIKTFELTTKLLNEGVFVNPVIPPAVSPGDSLIRFSLMATHTKEQIDRAMEIILKVAQEVRINLRQAA